MKFMYALGIIVSSYALYKYKQKATHLLMVHSNNRLSRLFHLINAKLFENFKPSLFLFSGHAQTFLLELISIILRFFKKIFRFYNFRYKREIFILSDGCKIAVDHVKLRNKTKLVGKNYFDNSKIEGYDKILIVLPGITSTSDDYYVKALVEDFCDEFDCRVINARGFSGMKLESPLMISSACYKDLSEYIDKVASENPHKKIFGVGFSFGGMLLARYLGSNAEKVPSNFMAGCGLCYPCCLEKTKNYAEIHFNGIYSKASLYNVKETFYKHLDIVFDEKFHKGKKSESIILEKDKILKEVEGCTLLSDFDRIWTTRSLGFKHVSEYYDYSRMDQYVAKIRVPFLSIFAEDDPIIPIDSVPFKALQNNPYTVTVVTQHGGHLGFFGGLLIPQRIIDQPFRSFMKTVEILRDTQRSSENSFVN
jgi:predicted alpha/beta-fold hydrolase